MRNERDSSHTQTRGPIMDACWGKVRYGTVHKGTNHVPKAVSERDSDPLLIWKPDFTLCECKAISNQAFETWKRGVLDHDPPREPDSEDMWTQSSFGTWFVRVHFGNAHWSHAWVNQRSRNKILLAVCRSCSWLTVRSL